MILSAYDDIVDSLEELDRLIDRVNYTFYIVIAILIIEIITVLIVNGSMNRREKELNDLTAKVDTLNANLRQMNNKINDLLSSNSNKNY